jgi:cytoskeletal protein RodZ
MAGIGKLLTAAREARGFTAVEAAKRLHIRAMFVEAIEREDWRAVGEPVYVRGFLKNYAKLVGLDPEAAAAELDEAYAQDPQRPYSSVALRDESAGTLLDSRRGADTNWLVVATGVIAAVLLVAVVWQGIGLLRGGGGGTVAVSYSSPSPAANAPVASDANGAAAAPNPTPTSGVDLRLEATQSCWLSVTVDGKRVVYDTLPKGAVREFHAVREIILRAGNAGGIVATIDGKPLGTLGQVGQVEDRVFAVATPAQSQTVTP